MPNVADRAQQIDGLQNLIQVVRGLAHAHEDHFFDGSQGARQCHLGHDLGAADLPNQPFSAGHAKHATDGTTHLAGHTQAISWQQHAFHRLPIVQTHQQTR